MIKKFSIRELEKARQNPIDFAKLLKSEDKSEVGFGGYPKSMRWLNAICKYHEKKDISEAILSIEKGFSNRKDTAKNRQELGMFIEALGAYEIEIKNRKYSLIKTREPINIILSPLIRLSGQIPIIFMKPTIGFSAFFVARDYPLWKAELKYPVIQYFVANNIFSSDIKDIDVGYIDYYSGKFNDVSYSKKEINLAMAELESLGKTISMNLA